jgi:hypothetical protein
MAVEIRRVTTTADLDAVCRFRYRIYVGEMNRWQIYADHAKETTVEPLDGTAVAFAAWDGNDIGGTVRSNYLRSSDIGSYFKMYDLSSVPGNLLEDTSITTKLMVSAANRRSTLPVRLACAAYESGLNAGLKLDFIDCNANLVGFFSGLGYVPHREGLSHPEYGLVTVMRLEGTSLDLLARTRSPFYNLLCNHMARQGHVKNCSDVTVPTVERRTNEYECC